MIDVLKRLAELDEKNPNVVNPQSQKTKQKQQVKESAPVAECGPMGMMGGMDRPSTPASFSINASAADGQEVSQMLRDIMNLAGVHKSDSADSMPMDKEPVTGADDHVPDDKELMRAMLDTMNEPDDGAVIPAAPPMPATNLPPPEMGDGGDMALDVGPEEPMSLDGGDEVPDDVGDMADHVRDMADELADKDKEDLGLESYDNTPADPTQIPKFDANKMAFNPNAGGANKGLTNQPTATLEDQLYNEYKKFVSEAKGKCNHTPKGEKCPVHGLKECGMREEKEKTMSRAAKGIMKYGKKGMKALADAGKKGKNLEPVRAKYNKYD